jgi:predicted flap endonuclease-1-like 5' DNA nuclease
VPDSVLGQLGLKVQHALRAFTAKDRKDISKTAENYPISTFYKTDETLTSMGIGEALVTALNEKGIPTPLAHVLLRPPVSRMDILSESEIQALVSKSPLVRKYNVELDRDSAFELLEKKISRAEAAAEEASAPAARKTTSTKAAKETSLIDELSKNTMVRQIGRTIFRELTRGILGSISGKKR